MLHALCQDNTFAKKNQLYMDNNIALLVAFGKKVQSLRKKMTLSQEELAFRAGFHRTYIGMIERGERNITLSNLKKLADALNISLSDLFKDE